MPAERAQLIVAARLLLLLYFLVAGRAGRDGREAGHRPVRVADRAHKADHGAHVVLRHGDEPVYRLGLRRLLAPRGLLPRLLPAVLARRALAWLQVLLARLPAGVQPDDNHVLLSRRKEPKRVHALVLLVLLPREAANGRPFRLKCHADLRGAVLPLLLLAADAVREQHLHVDEKDRALALLAAVGRHQSVGDLAGEMKELS